MRDNTVPVIYSDKYEPLPKVVEDFRRIINEIKRKLLESLEKPDKHVDIQDIRRLDSTQDRIHHIGNILMVILSPNISEHSESSLKNIDKVLDLFSKFNFDFDRLIDPERELCKHYVNNDIFVNPNDLKPLNKRKLE